MTKVRFLLSFLISFEMGGADMSWDTCLGLAWGRVAPQTPRLGERLPVPPDPPRQGDLAWEALGRGSTELAERLRFAEVFKQTPAFL